jgi:uncharacterized protein (DUF2249 family)
MITINANTNVRSVVELDVRPLLSAGGDPLNEIMKAVHSLPDDGALKIINTFTPAPLITLLEKKGFSAWTDRLGDHLVHTWFYRSATATQSRTAATPSLDPDAWKSLVDRFAGKLQSIDVRGLPMPLPMMTILESLDRLLPGNALLVEHQRIPVFLLPELADRRFDYRILEKSTDHVQLLIFKKVDV